MYSKRRLEHTQTNLDNVKIYIQTIGTFRWTHLVSIQRQHLCLSSPIREINWEEGSRSSFSFPWHTVTDPLKVKCINKVFLTFCDLTKTRYWKTRLSKKNFLSKQILTCISFPIDGQNNQLWGCLWFIFHLPDPTSFKLITVLNTNWIFYFRYSSYLFHI